MIFLIFVIFQEPVIITRNGVSDLAVMTIETYEEITGIRNLINLLEEADNDIENGNFLTEKKWIKNWNYYKKTVYKINFSNYLYEDVESSINY